MSDYVHLGRIVRHHGYKGAVKIKLSGKITTGFHDVEALFILKNDRYLPYFLESWEYPLPNLLIAKLEGVDDKEAIANLRGKEVFIQLSDMQEPVVENTFTELIGYTAIDQSFGAIGAVDDVIEMPGQWVASILHHDKEVLLPLIEDQIIQIDQAAKTITFNLPEGLLEIYI